MRKNKLFMLGALAMSGALSSTTMFAQQENDTQRRKDHSPDDTKKKPSNVAQRVKMKQIDMKKNGLNEFVINVAGSDYTICVLNAKNAKRKEISLNLAAYKLLGEHMFEYVKPSPKYSENIAGCRKAYEDAKKSTLLKINSFKNSYISGMSSTGDLIFEEISNGGSISKATLNFLS